MNPLLINAAELLRRPGKEKDVRVTLTAAELGIDDPRIAAEAPVTIAAHLESLSDGIVVTGTAEAPWHDICRRCLDDIDETAVAELHELYQHHVTVDDAFPIVGEQIDLTEMARELVLLELPLAALCRPDCAGLCPVCGVNRNEEQCECETTPTDERWSALDELKQQLN
jgi:uncharacterized protein